MVQGFERAPLLELGQIVIVGSHLSDGLSWRKIHKNIHKKQILRQILKLPWACECRPEYKDRNYHFFIPFLIRKRTSAVNTGTECSDSMCWMNNRMISRSVPCISHEQSMPKSPHVMKANGTRSISSDPVRPSNDDFTPDHHCCSASLWGKNTLFCFLSMKKWLRSSLKFRFWHIFWNIWRMGHKNRNAKMNSEEQQKI